MADEDSPVARLRMFFLDPDTFFRDLAGQPPRYRGPLLVLLITGILTAVSGYLMLHWMFSVLITGFFSKYPEYPLSPSILHILVVVNAGFTVIIPFAIAIGAGLVFYILAGFVSKSGSLVHTITATGWGMVPLGVYKALEIPMLLVFLSGMNMTVSPELFTLMSNSTSASTVTSEVMKHMITFDPSYYTFTMVMAILHVLAWLCCAWFWIPAVRNTCSVEPRQAAIIVLVPLLVYLAVSFGPVLVTGGHGL